MPPNKPKASDKPAKFPPPQFGASGKGIPVSQFNIILLVTLLCPHMEMPTRKGPKPGMLKKPKSIKNGVAVKGG